jgi:hypothetical protein
MNDNCVSSRTLKLQIPPSPLRPHFVKARVKVHVYPDGSHALFHGPRRIGLYDEKGAIKECQRRRLNPLGGKPCGHVDDADASPIRPQENKTRRSGQVNSPSTELAYNCARVSLRCDSSPGDNGGAPPDFWLARRFAPISRLKRTKSGVFRMIAGPCDFRLAPTTTRALTVACQIPFQGEGSCPAIASSFCCATAKASGTCKTCSPAGAIPI